MLDLSGLSWITKRQWEWILRVCASTRYSVIENIRPINYVLNKQSLHRLIMNEKSSIKFFMTVTPLTEHFFRGLSEMLYLKILFIFSWRYFMAGRQVHSRVSLTISTIERYRNLRVISSQKKFYRKKKVFSDFSKYPIPTSDF